MQKCYTDEKPIRILIDIEIILLYRNNHQQFVHMSGWLKKSRSIVMASNWSMMMSTWTQFLAISLSVSLNVVVVLRTKKSSHMMQWVFSKHNTIHIIIIYTFLVTVDNLLMNICIYRKISNLHLSRGDDLYYCQMI